MRRALTGLVFALLAPALALAQDAPPANGGDCGSIVTEANNDISSFNPLFAQTEGDSRAAQLLFQPLIWVDRDGKVDARRSVALINVAQNGAVYNLTLQPWHWSDGVAVTAADVLYDWRMIQSLGPNWPGFGGGGLPQMVKSIIAPDPLHLVITLTRPVNADWFIDNGLASLIPLPAHAWSRLSLAQLFQAQSDPKFFQVTDGPLRIARLDVGMDAAFVPNPHYDGPKMHFSQLVENFLHSDGAAVQQLQAGTLDEAAVPMDLFAAVQHLPGLRVQKLPPVSFFYYIDLNERNPRVAFFRDVQVRQAIQDSIDQKAIVAQIYHGFGAPVYTPIPPVDGWMLSPDLAAGKGPVGFDPAHAAALLQAAGYAKGPDGIWQKHGQRLAFTLLLAADSGESLELLELTQAQLRRNGIDMQLRLMAFGEMMQVTQADPKGWEAAMHGTVMAPYPSGEGMFASNAGGNDNGYSDPQMDRLIDDSVDKPGLAGLQAYEEYAEAQQPYIFLTTQTPLMLVAARLHGVENYGDGELLRPDALYCTARR